MLILYTKIKNKKITKHKICYVLWLTKTMKWFTIFETPTPKLLNRQGLFLVDN